MPFKYATVLVKNPKTKLREVRARAVSDSISLDTIANAIAAKNTVTYPDVLAVIRSLLEATIDALKNGDMVHLGDLGTIYPTLSSQAATKEDTFNAAMIEQVRVRFRPAKQFSQVVNTNLAFTKTITKKQQAVAKKAAIEAQNAALKTQEDSGDDGE